jgi:hypothetical protein
MTRPEEELAQGQGSLHESNTPTLHNDVDGLGAIDRGPGDVIGISE